MDSDRRKHPRTDVSERAVISFGGWSTHCVLRNLSADGAALDIEDGIWVPDHFTLMLEVDRRTFDCRTVWTSKGRVGVSFGGN